MKIHIVQKGDTLWELAKKYNVDFEDLKQANSHLSSPDMIMPGMKIKIPSSTKPVKKQTMKEKQKMDTSHLYKDTTPKAMPIIKEDDKKAKQMIQPEMPKQSLPQIPMMPFPQFHSQPAEEKKKKQVVQQPSMKQEVKHYTTINMPKMDDGSKKEQHVSKSPQKDMGVKEAHVQAKHHQPYTHYMPECMPPFYQHMPPVAPVHYPYFHPCPPVPCPPMPMYHMPYPSVPPTNIGSSDCGCGGGSQVGPDYQGLHQQSWGNPYYSESVNMPHLQTNLSMPSFGGFHGTFRDPSSQQSEENDISGQEKKNETDRE